MEQIQLRWFQIKIATAECTQISNSDEDLLWGVTDNSINYCSNDLKKLPDVVLIKNPKSLNKYPLNSSLSKKFLGRFFFWRDNKGLHDCLYTSCNTNHSTNFIKCIKLCINDFKNQWVRLRVLTRAVYENIFSTIENAP